MAGAIGAGGLGYIAIYYGYNFLVILNFLDFDFDFPYPILG